MAVNINVPSQVKTFANLAAFPATGALKTIYIAEDTNKTYRWTGSVYTEISASAAMTWGAIGGTLSNQTDLQNALDAKQDDITLTTTGSSGASTLVGSTLNVPNYTLSGLGGVPTSRTLTINGVTQDLSANRTFTISTGITIGSTAIASGVVGRVLFEGAGNVVQESSSLFWDDTNARLGIGTSSPSSTLSVGSSASANSVSGATPLIVQGSANSNFNLYIKNDSTNSVASAQIVTQVGGTGGAFGIYATYPSTYNYGVYPANGSALINGGTGGLALVASNAVGIIKFATGGELAAQERMRIFASGNLGIGTTTDAGFRLDVNGTARVQTSLEVVGASGITLGGGASALTYTGTQLNIGNSASWTDVRLFAGGVQKFSQTSTLTTISNTTINLSTATVQLAGVNALTYSGTDIRIGSVSAGFNSLSMYVAGSERARIASTGNLLINTTTDAGFRLDVNGTARVSGNLAFVTGNTYINSTSNHMWIAAVTSTSTDIQMIPGRQVNINNTGTYTAQASAILQTDSTTKGFLPPRMTTTQKNAIASPAAGLMVYDTTLNVISYYNGSMWI